jgi:hypothetical protein
VREEGGQLMALAKQCSISHQHHLTAPTSSDLPSSASSSSSGQNNMSGSGGGGGVDGNNIPMSSMLSYEENNNNVDKLANDVKKWLKGLDLSDTTE